MRKNWMILWLLVVGFVPASLSAQVLRALTVEEVMERDDSQPRDKRDVPFPPHRVIGNVYYVGTYTMSSFLITTPEGHFLINTTFERTLPVIRKSVEDLGFRFEDIKIVLGSHAHDDHQEADALAKELTGAQVMAMDRDVPLLEQMTPGGKPHPIDRVLHHQDEITLGGTTVVAHRTPGHTEGTTTFGLEVEEEGARYDVIIHGGLRVGGRTVLVDNEDYPNSAQDFIDSFNYMRSVPCDVVLASHPHHYFMAEKHAVLGKGPNPFIEPEGCVNLVENWERLFYTRLEEQKR